MYRFLPVFIFLVIVNQVKGQQQINITSSVPGGTDYKLITDQQINYMNDLYVREIGITDELINGKEYIPYYFKCKIKPLLFEEKKRSGSLLFNGRRYNNLSLEYDTYLDELIYYDSLKFIEDKQFKLALNPDKVDEFSLFFKDDTMRFRYYSAPDGGTFNLPEGFYEVVYEGRTRCIIQHKSFLGERDGLEEYRYIPREYILAGGTYTRVRSAAGFIKLFGKNSDLVRKYMRVNNIHFRRAGKNELTAVLKYYDTWIAPDK